MWSYFAAAFALLLAFDLLVVLIVGYVGRVGPHDSSAHGSAAESATPR